MPPSNIFIDELCLTVIYIRAFVSFKFHVTTNRDGAQLTTIDVFELCFHTLQTETVLELCLHSL